MSHTRDLQPKSTILVTQQTQIKNKITITPLIVELKRCKIVEVAKNFI